MLNFQKILKTLVDHKVNFIIIGGVAAVAHGSSRLTQDIDVVYERSDENIRRLVASLKEFRPYLRGAPPNLPFQWGEETLKYGLNFTLVTTLGAIDLLGELTGGGKYTHLIEHTVLLQIFGVQCRCINLEKLIEVKRAAGRPKDFEVIAELEAILEERK